MEVCSLCTESLGLLYEQLYANLIKFSIHQTQFGTPVEEIFDGVHTGQILGVGASGTVREVVHRATGVQYAIKCFDTRLIDAEQGLQQLREEILIMCQVDHPNIVRVEEVYESEVSIYKLPASCGLKTIIERY
jgi:calcium-dependent protein kinase